MDIGSSFANLNSFIHEKPKAAAAALVAGAGIVGIAVWQSKRSAPATVSTDTQAMGWASDTSKVPDTGVLQKPPVTTPPPISPPVLPPPSTPSKPPVIVGTGSTPAHVFGDVIDPSGKPYKCSSGDILTYEVDGKGKLTGNQVCMNSKTRKPYPVIKK